MIVIGGDDRIDGLTVMIDKHGIDLHLGSLNIKCLQTPCHTTGHVCYYVHGEPEGVVFTGTYLFFFCGKSVYSLKEWSGSCQNALAKINSFPTFLF